MPTFPAFKTKPYYDALKAWLTTSLNEDGTLRSDAVQAEVSAALADNQTVVDAAAAAVDANPTISDHEMRIATTETVSDVLSALRFDPAHPTYGAVRDDPGAAATNVTAINAAAEAARTAGGILVLRGTYHINGTVTIRCHVDAEGATLIAPDTLAPAVRVGTVTSGATDHWLRVVLPRIRTTKTTGAGVWNTGVGVEFVNLNSCHITIPHVQNFGTNMKLTAVGEGNAYNTYVVGHLDNGKINQHITPGLGGWVNENTFAGTGRYSHYSHEGTNVVGTRHVLGTSNGQHPINNNKWVKGSFEGNTPEFHVDIAGMINAMPHARWEAATPKLRISGANSSIIVGPGYDAQRIVWTFADGANLQYQEWATRNFMWKVGSTTEGVYVGTNWFSDTSGTFTVMAGTDGFDADRAARYLASIGGTRSRFKRATDAHPRVEIDHANGALKLGNGVAAPDVMLGRAGSPGWLTLNTNLAATKALYPGNGAAQQFTAGIFGGTGSPEGSVTAGVGSLYLRTDGGAGTSLYVKESGTGNTGWRAV